MIRTLLAFLWRDILSEFSYKLHFILQIIGIFPIVMMFFFLSRVVGESISGPLDPYGGSYFPFVLIGIAVQNYLTFSLTAFSSNLRDAQLSGTLEAMLVTPVTLTGFLAGSAAYTFLISSIRILMYLVFGVIFFGVHFHWRQTPTALTALALTVAAFSGFGILSGGFIIFFKRGDPLNWGFNVISWLLGGVYYPVSVLPDWMQSAAQWIPMTHSLECLRLTLISGKGFSDVSGHLISLGIWAAICLPAGLLCFSFAIERARVNGTLGHY